jgi:hypothetical protein
MAPRNRRESAELVGLIAIVVSLALLGYEIRQNTLAIQATALQQHFEQHTALILARLDNPDLRASLTKGSGGLNALTIEDLGLYGPYTASITRNHFVAYELMRSGILPESQWQTFRAALGRHLGRSLGARELWELRREEYTEEFRTMVDALVAEAETAEPSVFE